MIEREKSEERLPVLDVVDVSMPGAAAVTARVGVPSFSGDALLPSAALVGDCLADPDIRRTFTTAAVVHVELSIDAHCTSGSCVNVLKSLVTIAGGTLVETIDCSGRRPLCVALSLRSRSSLPAHVHCTWTRAK